MAPMITLALHLENRADGIKDRNKETSEEAVSSV